MNFGSFVKIGKVLSDRFPKERKDVLGIFGRYVQKNNEVSIQKDEKERKGRKNGKSYLRMGQKVLE